MNAREKNGRFYANVRYGRAKRLEIRVPWARSLEEASSRAVVIREAADKLVAVGRRDLVKGTARELAEAHTESLLAKVLKAIAAMLKGARPGASADTTFEDLANRYVDGELAKEFPDYVKLRDYSDDRSRLRLYILVHIADVRIVDFDMHHAQLVLSRLPSTMSEANRRQVAQVIGRILHLAVHPLRLIKASPLPRGWLPKITKRRHYSCLFPAEDRKLLGCADVAEELRLFFGILAREGMRESELLDSDWSQWGLDVAETRGTFLATKTKTSDPRMWAVRPDVARAMRIHRERVGTGRRPFAYVAALGDRLAERFRAAVKTAGIDRAELFENTEYTGQLRAHDLRATFVTISLAEGKSETWIRDRTAHKSTAMIDRYRRTARQFAELELGSLCDLVEGLGWWKAGGKGAGSDPVREDRTDEKCTGRGSNPHVLPRRNLNPLGGPEATSAVEETRWKSTSRDVTNRPSTGLPPPPARPHEPPEADLTGLLGSTTPEPIVDGSNRRHPDFQSSPTPQKTPDDVPDLSPTWAANGQPDGDTRTAPAEAVPSRGDASDPPSKALVAGAVGIAVLRELDGLLEDAFTVGAWNSEPTCIEGSREGFSPDQDIGRAEPKTTVVHRDVKPANVVKPPAKASPRVLEETKKRSRGGRS